MDSDAGKPVAVEVLVDVARELLRDPERFDRCRDLIRCGLREGRLRPVIAKTFPLAQIVDAHRYLESNQQIGKIAVTA